MALTTDIFLTVRQECAVSYCIIVINMSNTFHSFQVCFGFSYFLCRCTKLAAETWHMFGVPAREGCFAFQCDWYAVFFQRILKVHISYEILSVMNTLKSLSL